MAQIKYGQFFYADLQLKKKHCLGNSPRGSVHKVDWNGLTCAAKYLEPTQGNREAMGGGGEEEGREDRFQEAHVFLMGARHPHLLLYLGVSMTQGVGQSVLLMEMLPESLTVFLARQPQLHPHTKTRICHEVALALAYLHGNNILHGNLCSNNVLLTSSQSAKVSDFGLLNQTNQKCHGPSHHHGYQPPETRMSPPSYSDKSDIFTWGVLALYVLTQHPPSLTSDHAPSSTPHHTPSSTPDHTPSPTSEALPSQASEVERRQVHIDLVAPGNKVMVLVLQALQNQLNLRPVASSLCLRLKEREKGEKEKEEKEEEEKGEEEEEGEKEEEREEGGKGKQQLQEETEQLRCELVASQEEQRRLDEEVRRRDREVANLRWQVQDEQNASLTLRSRLSQHEQRTKLHSNELALLKEEAAKCLNSMVQAQRHSQQSLKHISKIEHQMVGQAEEMEHLKQLLELEVNAHHTDISALDERLQAKIITLKKELREASHTRPLQKAISNPHIPSLIPSSKHTTLRPIPSLPAPNTYNGTTLPNSLRPVSTLDQLAPQGALRAPAMFHTGVAVTHHNMCYFSSFLSNEVFSFDSSKGKWVVLPLCPVSDFGLEVVEGEVTLVGGRMGRATGGGGGGGGRGQSCSKILLSLEEGVMLGGKTEGKMGMQRGVWREKLPAMSLARSHPATTCNQRLLVVAGGEIGDQHTFSADIEVLDLGCREWAKISSSPLVGGSKLTAVFVRDQLVLTESKSTTELDSAHSLSLPELLNVLRGKKRRRSLLKPLPWKPVPHIPASNSTYCNQRDMLLAVGGMHHNGSSANQIWAYSESNKKWKQVGTLKMARYRCLVGVVNSNMFVVGGLTKIGLTDNTEVFASV